MIEKLSIFPQEWQAAISNWNELGCQFKLEWDFPDNQMFDMWAGSVLLNIQVTTNSCRVQMMHPEIEERVVRKTDVTDYNQIAIEFVNSYVMTNKDVLDMQQAIRVAINDLNSIYLPELRHVSKESVRKLREAVNEIKVSIRNPKGAV
ncbi:hypothetical protein [Tumebacillus permanentifrigoris]|uniref:Uncharacterized protein n=1 Tax=Tumebacillus permanentifrigoris TaxID=378543 RepID=A0A316D692_9BACL|nr:hypothetical protein [Tumebacillus permanentifrigoris]PWK10183.1 hypothetical protein C7459_1124 [Tumebacillus permanentifrigoris]